MDHDPGQVEIILYKSIQLGFSDFKKEKLGCLGEVLGNHTTQLCGNYMEL